MTPDPLSLNTGRHLSELSLAADAASDFMMVDEVLLPRGLSNCRERQYRNRAYCKHYCGKSRLKYFGYLLHDGRRLRSHSAEKCHDASDPHQANDQAEYPSHQTASGFVRAFLPSTFEGHESPYGRIVTRVERAFKSRPPTLHEIRALLSAKTCASTLSLRTTSSAALHSILIGAKQWERIGRFVETRFHFVPKTFRARVA